MTDIVDELLYWRDANCAVDADDIDKLTSAAAEEIESLRAERKEAGVSFLLRWMQAKNPMLGDVTPLELLDMGRGEKLAAFIRGAIEEQP